MLDELDEIDWSQLTHAFGSASDVPGLIRALLAPAEETREEAVNGLFETIWHQGTVYQASAHAVPFLQALLRMEDAPEKLAVAQLLAELADGGGYLEFTKYSPEMERLTRESLAREGRDFEEEVSESQHYVQETRAAVGQDLTLLYPYLGCAIPEIRGAVARALRHYPERAGATLPLIEAAVQGEDDPEAREAMEKAIATLRTGGE